MKPIFFSFFFVTAPAVCCAQVASYECGQYPEQVGWTRDVVEYPAQRWIEAFTEGNDWLAQYTENVVDPYAPRQDWYRRSISEFADAQAFFAEWRLFTDGDRAAIPSGAPAGFVASGNLGIRYHFTIASDQARLIDPYLNVTLFEISPSMAHTYRLEVRDKVWRVYIDGALVNTGLATKSYPTTDSVIVFGARAPADPATTRWDYIRFGVIPDDAGAGDLNCDGTLNQFDIDPFIAALVSADGYGQQHPACNRLLADTNADGSVNQFDIIPFVDLLMP